MRHAFPLFFIISFVIIGTSFSTSTAFAAVGVGDSPKVESSTVESEAFDLKKHRGKVVLIDFWATWCGPCKKALPVYSKLVSEYDGQFVVAAVSVDAKRSGAVKFLKSQVPQTLAQEGFAILWEKKHPLASQFGPPSIPTGYLIDPTGVVREVYTGFDDSSEAQLKRDIDALLLKAKSSQ